MPEGSQLEQLSISETVGFFCTKKKIHNLKVVYKLSNVLLLSWQTHR